MVGSSGMYIGMSYELFVSCETLDLELFAERSEILKDIYNDHDLIRWHGLFKCRYFKRKMNTRVYMHMTFQ